METNPIDRTDSAALQALTSILKGIEQLKDEVNSSDDLKILERNTPFFYAVRPEDNETQILVRKISERISRLNELYAEDDMDIGYTLGYLSVCEGRRQVLRGFVERARAIPLAPPFSRRLALALITIKEIRAKVVRELHHGVHYHYCLMNGNRTDTVMCFDAPGRWPLYAEKHAANGKTPARPGAWVEEKRSSLYNAVYGFRDANWSPTVYRKPSSSGTILVGMQPEQTSQALSPSA